MILSDRSILEAMDRGEIVIDPFIRSNLGSNSYDVTLGKNFCTYLDPVLDCAKEPKIAWSEMSDQGVLLRPGELYLMVTQEYTETRNHVPFLEGKSSLGRLGVSIHVTAGKGDEGFKGYWTLEVTCVGRPVRVYPGMPVGQLIYYHISTQTDVPYTQKASAKYNNRTVDADGYPLPIPSYMYKNFKG